MTSHLTRSPYPAIVPEPPKKKFLDQCRDVARYRQLSRRTEDCYVNWIRQFILHHGKRHPSEMGPDEIREFLTALAVQRHVAAATQNQALCALLFLYRDVLRRGVERDILLILDKVECPLCRSPTSCTAFIPSRSSRREGRGSRRW